MVTQKKLSVTLKVNGQEHLLTIKPQWTLAKVIREELGLTGTKVACAGGECGACTVIVDGVAVASCITLAADCEGKEIETIENLSKKDEKHPLQNAWLEEYGSQCGFCSPGMIMGSKALLDKNPLPTVGQIQDALSGNLCICSNYDHIINSVQKASKDMASKEGKNE